MSPLKRSNNIAARMGRWSASHWKTAVFGWLGFVVLAVALGTAVGTKQLKVEDANVGQAKKADEILKQGFPQSNPQTEFVVVQSATKTVSDPAFRAAIEDVVNAVEGDPATKNFKSPLTPGHADQISKNRRTASLGFVTNAAEPASGDAVAPRRRRCEELYAGCGAG